MSPVPCSPWSKMTLAYVSLDRSEEGWAHAARGRRRPALPTLGVGDDDALPVLGGLAGGRRRLHFESGLPSRCARRWARRPVALCHI